jgi:hypothetical protein
MEDLPSMTFWKKGWWPMPQPEMTPRPVTTTRFLVAERAVDVRDGVSVVEGRRVKAAMPVVVQRRMFRGAEVVSLMVSLAGVVVGIVGITMVVVWWIFQS